MTKISLCKILSILESILHMLKITEKLIENNLVGKLITDNDLKQIIGKSPASRFGLVHKAFAHGELISLKRGCYLLALKYQPYPVSQFYIASHMIPHSYISFESALAYHGWIPERVVICSSVIHQGRSKTFSNPVGEFSYTYIPINKYEFLSGVLRNELDAQPFLIATPLRALCDLIYIRKLKEARIDFLIDSLRIEYDTLKTLTAADFKEIETVYKVKYVNLFLATLKESLNIYDS